MKSFSLSRAVVALGMMSMPAWAQAPGTYGSPSLLGLPAANYGYTAPVEPVGYYPGNLWNRPQATTVSTAPMPESGPAFLRDAAAPVDPDTPPSPSDAQHSPYTDAMSGNWGDGCSSCGGAGGCGGGCGDCGCGYGYGCGRCGWFGAVNGLIMSRNDGNFNQISYDDTNLIGQVLSTNSASMGWTGGFQTTIGRWLDGGVYGIEATYWGIFSGTREANVLASSLVGNLNTVFDFTPLNIGATNVNDLYDAAAAHRIRRDYEFHNVEINLLQGDMYSMGAGGRLQVSGLAGVRFFRFRETFSYASADTNPVFGADPANEAYYDINVVNNLVGFQLGARANYWISDRVRFHALPKIGLYGNRMTHHSRIYNVNGTAVVGPGNPLAGEAFDITSNEDGISFLGEIDLGLDYQITRRLSVSGGYRALALTSVALATDQIPRHFADLPGVADIDSNSSLILHGAYAGMTFNY